MSNNVAPLYSARNIEKLFPVTGGVLRRTIGHVRALDSVDLDIYRGETISVIGESGCGKTTLGRVLSLLQKPTSGELSFDFGNGLQDVTKIKGDEELKFRKRVQMIFQDPYTSFNPRQRVGVAMDEVLQVQGIREPEERHNRIHAAMEMVNMRNWTLFHIHYTRCCRCTICRPSDCGDVFRLCYGNSSCSSSARRGRTSLHHRPHGLCSCNE